MELVTEERPIVQLVLGNTCSANVAVLNKKDISIWLRGILIKDTIPDKRGLSQVISIHNHE